MTASSLRDVLLLHAGRGDRQKQRQEAKDRHEEVQRFFHASKFDAVPKVFDTDWNNYLLFRFYSSAKQAGKRAESIFRIVSSADWRE